MRSPLPVCSVLALTACAVGPDYARPELDTPERFRFAAAETSEVVDIAWWQQFGDPVLDELIATALAENEDLRIAAARVEEFAGRLTAARSLFFPQIGYGAEAARERTTEAARVPIPAGIDPVGESYQAIASASWEIDLWGRIRRESEAARADLLATEQARRGVVLSLVGAVSIGYATLRDLDRQLEIAQRTLATREQTLELFEVRRRGGVISELQLVQARSQYESARATIPDLQTAIAQQENALALLLGRNPGPIPRGKPIDELTPPAIPAGLPSDLLERRPDLLETEQRLIAANARIGAVKALYFPTISLTGAFGSASAELDDLFQGPAKVWSYAGSITGPLFTGGYVQSLNRQARAQTKQALLAYERNVQNAFREVDDALLAAANISDRLDALSAQVQALSDYDRLARLRYDSGYTSYIEVLDAQRSLFAAELELSRTRGDLLRAHVALYQAMGGGWIDAADALTVAEAP